MKEYLYKDRYFIAAAVVIGAMATVIFNTYSYAEQTVEDMASKVIRFHVIANSDSPEDQDLKRAVRDEILKVMSPKLKESKDLEQSREILLENKELMEEIAEKTIKAWDKEYEVEAKLTESYFPTKRYGDIVFPAGTYEAMKIIIGKGEGQNWWCVMFPPLCFVDATNGVVPETSKKDLESVLQNKEQYELLLAANQGEPTIQVKFKVIEVWESLKQSTKVKMAKLQSK